jgi:sterol O-acyltransferase
MPIVAIQRLPFIHSQAVLMNIMFWICMITGLALVSSTETNKPMNDGS